MTINEFNSPEKERERLEHMKYFEFIYEVCNMTDYNGTKKEYDEYVGSQKLYGYFNEGTLGRFIIDKVRASKKPYTGWTKMEVSRINQANKIYKKLSINKESPNLLFAVLGGTAEDLIKYVEIMEEYKEAKTGVELQECMKLEEYNIRSIEKSRQALGIDLSQEQGE